MFCRYEPSSRIHFIPIPIHLKLNSLLGVKTKTKTTTDHEHVMGNQTKPHRLSECPTAFSPNSFPSTAVTTVTTTYYQFSKNRFFLQKKFFFILLLAIHTRWDSDVVVTIILLFFLYPHPLRCAVRWSDPLALTSPPVTTTPPTYLSHFKESFSILLAWLAWLLALALAPSTHSIQFAELKRNHLFSHMFTSNLILSSNKKNNFHFHFLL